MQILWLFAGQNKLLCHSSATLAVMARQGSGLTFSWNISSFYYCFDYVTCMPVIAGFFHGDNKHLHGDDRGSIRWK